MRKFLWYYIRISYVENKYVGTYILLRLESVGKWSWVWDWIMMRLVLSDGRDFFGLGLCLPFLIWKFQTNLLWRLLMKFKCGSTLLYLLQGILPWAEIWADFFRLAVDLFLSFFQWDIIFFFMLINRENNLRRFFLFDHQVAFLLWVVSYVGSVFNFLTLVYIGEFSTNFIIMFS